MRAVDERQIPTARGGILYDVSRFVKPDERWFSRDYWASASRIVYVAGGRGGVGFIDADAGQWVLRHYLRGGAIARLSRDSYLWLGERRVRSFAEWRLLAQMTRLGLPVPAPIAARYTRDWCTYRADLMTERLPTSRTLAHAITGGALDAESWRTIGGTIGAFHAHGVHHADLNAHNILVDQTHSVYLLDFDRGRIRPRGLWEERVLAGLRRSLDKIAGAGRSVSFSEDDWQSLMDGYRQQK